MQKIKEYSDSNKLIKVAHITLCMEPGGIENFVVNFSRYINRSRFMLSVICLDSGGILLDEINSSGFKSFVLSRNAGVDWKLIISLARIFLKEKIDIVHTHNEAAHFYAGLAAKLILHPCLVTTEHSRHYIDDNYKIRRLQKILMSKITDRWITVSGELARLSIVKDGLSSKKVVSVQNGIDINQFIQPYMIKNELAELKESLNIPENAKIIIMVARFHPVKNHALFIQAISGIRGQIDNLHVIFLGDGELRDELIKLTKKLGLDNIIHFLGYKKNVGTFLWLSDIFVLCSKTEGLPFSLLEALAAKIPVIITRSANRAELIKDGINGKIVESDTDSLSSALITLLKNPNSCKRMSENGFDFVKEHFSIERMIKSYEDIYENILGKKREKSDK